MKMKHLKCWGFLLSLVFLSACGGGGGGGGGDTAPPIIASTTPNLSVSTNAVTLNEDFGTFIINTTATDVEDGTLSVTVSGQAGLLTTDITTGRITLTSVANANGVTTLTVRATDSGNLSATTEVVVTINDAPTLTLSTTNLSLSEDFGTFVINTTASDAEDGVLPVAVTGQDASLFAVTTSTDQIILTSVANANGIATLTVSIVDSGNLSATTEVVVVVNASPTLTLSTTNLSLNEDFGTFIINTTATDVEDGTLSVTVSGQAGLLTTDITTGRITLTSVANANGVTTLTVRATDSGNLSATTEVVVTINDAPTLSLSTTNLILLPNSTGRITAVFADVETSSNLLTFVIQENTALVRVSRQGNDVIVLRSNTAAGSTTLVVTVTDEGGASASETVRVTVLSNVLNVALNVKRIDFSWGNFPEANHYRMLSNVDLTAGGGFVDASSANLVFLPNSTNIINTTVSAIVDVARYLSAVNGPEYLLQACTSVDNSVCSNLAQQTLTNAQLEGLIGYFKASNTGADDRFGRAVAISGDGNTLAVGAAFEDSDARGINGGTNDALADSGAVYVFVRNSAGTWAQQAYIKASNSGGDDQFGASVDLSNDGNTLLVGARFEDSDATGINGDETNNDSRASGAAYIFVRNSGGTWSQQAYAKASNTGSDDDFGEAVAISGDGNTLIVGASGEDSTATGINGDQLDNSTANSGAAYVFVRSSTGTWSQQVYLKASNAEAGDNFGRALSASSNGNTVIVAAPSEDSAATGINGNQLNNSTANSGAVYVFVRSSTGTWSQQAYVKASNTGTNDDFGFALSLSDDGNTMVVGAPAEDSNSTGVNGVQTNNGVSNSGAVYVFVRSSTGSWRQQAYLKASNTDNDDLFGHAVAISGDGNSIIVGAVAEESDATGINGDQTSNATRFSGAAYLFVRSGTTWSQQAYIKTTNPGFFDEFGDAVSISNDGKTFAVGARNEESSATGINGDQTNNSQDNAGAVYLY